MIKRMSVTLPSGKDMMKQMVRISGKHISRQKKERKHSNDDQVGI